MFKNYFLILLFLLATSCGYKSVYSNSERGNYEIIKSEFFGDEEINKIIEKRLIIKKKDGASEKNFRIKITSLSNIEVKSKNNKGQPDIFEITLEVKLNVESDNRDEEYEKVFITNTTYKNSDNKFSLSQYEKIMKKNITNRIINNIKNYLNFL
tara:strand:+ start:2147 stop:2608 length:462 start_codon:yes stop_codon:yes gene_type:complete